MAKIDWKRAKTDYIVNEELSLSDIAAKYGVDLGHLYNVAAEEKWKELREEIKAKSEEKLKTIVSETIAEVNFRHAGIGKAFQGLALEAVKAGVRPTTANDVRLYALTGVRMERDALGLNDKEIKDEIYQKFQQFTFIFSLKEDELKRFIRSLDQELASRGIIEGTDIKQPISENPPQLNDDISESSV